MMIRSQKGSLLIFAVWILIVMTIFAVAIGFRARQKLRFLQTLEYRTDLRNIAMAGVRKAIAVLERDEKTDLSHNYSGKWSNSPQDFKNKRVGKGFFTVSYAENDGREEVERFGMIDEARKVNINNLSGPKILQKVFEEAADMDTGSADHIATAIMDFSDEDDSADLSGAETRYYRGQSPPYRAKNAPYEALEELYYVRGVNPDVYQKILPFITIYPNGSVNINTAPDGVLLGLGFSRQLLDEVNQFRWGPDRRKGTDDDLGIHDISTLADKLASEYSADESVVEELKSHYGAGLIGTRSVYFSVHSEAWIAERKEALAMDCIVSIHGRISRCRENFFSLEEKREVTS